MWLFLSNSTASALLGAPSWFQHIIHMFTSKEVESCWWPLIHLTVSSWMESDKEDRTRIFHFWVLKFECCISPPQAGSGIGRPWEFYKTDLNKNMLGEWLPTMESFVVGILLKMRHKWNKIASNNWNYLGRSIFPVSICNFYLWSARSFVFLPSTRPTTQSNSPGPSLLTRNYVEGDHI